MSISARLQELGIVLPEPVRPVATYVRYVQTGNLLFISVTGPGPEIRPGKLGAAMTAIHLSSHGLEAHGLFGLSRRLRRFPILSELNDARVGERVVDHLP